MDRRELLKLAAVVPAGCLALGPGVVRAQEGWMIGTIRDVVGKRSWNEDAKSYLQLRAGAFAYASIVTHFGRPAGTAPQDPPFKFLSALLPNNMGAWTKNGAPLANEFAKNNEAELLKAFNELTSHNSKNFLKWLTSVGLVPSGPLSVAILSGQALATVVSLARATNDDKNILDQTAALKLWFYPLCRLLQ